MFFALHIGTFFGSSINRPSAAHSFVDGDHDQGESGKIFCQTKCPHMKGSMFGACNHAMAFPVFLIFVD